MPQKQKPKRKKGARKKFFEAEIPLISTKVHLYSYSPEELEGNVIKLDLSRNLRGKNLEIKAKIKLDKENLTGDLLGLQLMPSYINRIMRRGTDYVEDSFEVTCKDSKLKVKPLMITRKRVSRVIRKTIRNAAKKHLESKMKIRNTEELFSDIMTGKLQKDLSLKIKKIYPLALCEIRVIKVLERLGKSDKSNKTDKTKSDKTEDKKEEKE
jgi:ribosomal protein S3AE